MNYTLAPYRARRAGSVPSLPGSLLTLILILPWAPLGAQQTDAAVTRKLEVIQIEIQALRERLRGARGKAGELEAQLARSESALGKVNKSLRTTASALIDKRKRLEALDTETRQLEAQLADQRGALKKQLRGAYMIGRQEKLKLWLNQEDPAAIGRTLVYYDYFNRTRRTRMAASRQTIAAVGRVRGQTRAAAAVLQQLSKQLAADKQAREKHRQARQAAVLAMRSEITATGQSIDGLLADERELRIVLERIEQARLGVPTEAGQAFARLRGKLPWPVKGAIDRNFGKRRGEQVLWQGAFIRAREGESVHAVANGRVAFADWMRGFGLLAIVDHGQGYMSLYGHNSSLYKSTGDWVRAGEILGRTGDSGGQKSSGLYFEIRHNGKPLDPSKWCSKANNPESAGG